MLALLFAGCGPGVPLDAVPIEGADAATEARIRAALAAFEADAGEDRVLLRRIRVADLGGRVGSTHHGSRTIELDLSGGELDQTLRHELCHLLVADEGLLEGTQSEIEAVRAELFDPAEPIFDPRAQRIYEEDRERGQAEAVALGCEVGLLGAATALEQDDCGTVELGKPGLRTTLAQWLVDHVWTARAAPEPVVPATGAAVRDRVRALGPTTEPTLLRVVPISGDPYHVNVHDGTRVDSDAEPIAGPRGLPPALGMELVTDPAGFEEGPAAAVGLWNFYTLGSEYRRVAHDGDRWRSAGCPPPEPRVFEADGRVWSSGTLGDVVFWEPLTD